MATTTDRGTGNGDHVSRLEDSHKDCQRVSSRTNPCLNRNDTDPVKQLLSAEHVLASAKAISSQGKD